MDIGNLTAQQNLRSILGWIVMVPLPTTVMPAAGVGGGGGGGVERVGDPLSLPQETRKSVSIKSETVHFIGDVHPHVIPDSLYWSSGWSPNNHGHTEGSRLFLASKFCI